MGNLCSAPEKGATESPNVDMKLSKAPEKQIGNGPAPVTETNNVELQRAAYEADKKKDEDEKKRAEEKLRLEKEAAELKAKKEAEQAAAAKAE
jgi:hypothetical protein